MTNEEYIASVASLNVPGDVIAFKAPGMVVDGIAKVVFRIGTIISYSPRSGDVSGTKVVKTRSGTEHSIADNDGTKWSFSDWDSNRFPVVRIGGQNTPAPIKPSLQVLALRD